MNRTSWLTLAGIGVGVTCVGWAFLGIQEQTQRGLPPTPWTIPALFLLIAIALFVFGWSVRQYQRGKRPEISGIRAARTAAFAKAASFVGASFTGWYGATVLIFLGSFLSEYRKGQAVVSVVAAISALILCVVGYVVEGFCQLPPPDDDKVSDPDFPDQIGPA